MKIENSKGSSPYAKYAKTPFRYSEVYTKWAQTAQDHGLLSEQTMEADRRFREKHNLPKAGKPRNFGDDIL